MKTLGILVHPGWADNESDRLEFYKDHLSKYDVALVFPPRLNEHSKNYLVNKLIDDIVRMYTGGHKSFSVSAIFRTDILTNYIDAILRKFNNEHSHLVKVTTKSGLVGNFRRSKYPTKVLVKRALLYIGERNKLPGCLFKGDATLVPSKNKFMDDLTSYTDSTTNIANLSLGSIGYIRSHIGTILEEAKDIYDFDNIELFGEYANECVYALQLELDTLGYTSVIKHEASVLTVTSSNKSTMDNLNDWVGFNYLDTL